MSKPSSKLAAAVGGDAKGKLSLALYAAAVPLAFVREWISTRRLRARCPSPPGAPCPG